MAKKRKTKSKKKTSFAANLLSEAPTDYRPDNARDPVAKNLRLIALLSNVWRADIRLIARLQFNENNEGWAMWEGSPIEVKICRVADSALGSRKTWKKPRRAIQSHLEF